MKLEYDGNVNSYKILTSLTPLQAKVICIAFEAMLWGTDPVVHNASVANIKYDCFIIRKRDLPGFRAFIDAILRLEQFK